MATVQKRGRSYRVLFFYRGKLSSFTLGKVSRDEAEAKAHQVDYLLMRLKQGLLHLPVGVPIEEYLQKDGKVEARGDAAPPPDKISFGRFRERYLQTHEGGAVEANSLATIATHLRHFETTLGEGFPLQGLSLADLQRHVTRRAKQLYRGKPLSPVTLKKEVASFRAAWNWAALTGLVKGPFPGRGLVYPKHGEKPPFQTRAEIERKIALGGLAAEEARELWDCLYLTTPEIEELLGFVGDNARHGFLYPW
jgi:hypothetical protein